MGLTVEQQRNKVREVKEVEKGKAMTKRKNNEPKRFNKGRKLIFTRNSFFGIKGIYFLYLNRKIVYIGESTCVVSRINQHHKEGVKDFNNFSFEEYKGSDKNRKKFEKDYIIKFKPKYNIVHLQKKRLKFVSRPM